MKSKVLIGNCFHTSCLIINNDLLFNFFEVKQTTKVVLNQILLRIMWNYQLKRVFGYLHELNWHNSIIKESLGNCLKKGFFLKSGPKCIFTSKDNLRLRMSSAGVRSDDGNIFLKKNPNIRIFDIDIKGFYGSILFNFNFPRFFNLVI